jgi:hypothetical protein
MNFWNISLRSARRVRQLPFGFRRDPGVLSVLIAKTLGGAGLDRHRRGRDSGGEALWRRTGWHLPPERPSLDPGSRDPPRIAAGALMEMKRRGLTEPTRPMSTDLT